MLRQYIVSNSEALTVAGQSRMLFQLIQVSLKITNSTRIYAQDSLINAFVSTVTFEDSELYNMNLQDTSIQVTSTTLNFTNMNVHDVLDPNNVDLIVLGLDSEFTISNVMYSNSDSVLFDLRSSSVQASNLTFENITNVNNLFTLYDAYDSDVSAVEVKNVTTTEDSLFDVRSSSGITFRDFSLGYIENTVIKIVKSSFAEISNMKIHHSTKAISITQSVVDLISDSEFTDNGNIGVINGGAINIMNGQVNILNSTFSGNTAHTGAAISFDCSSLEI